MNPSNKIVSYRVALALKYLGYKGKSLSYYMDGGLGSFREFPELLTGDKPVSNTMEGVVVAPSLTDALEWYQNKFKINIVTVETSMVVNTIGEHEKGFVYNFTKDSVARPLGYWTKGCIGMYLTEQDALEEGLRVGLEHKELIKDHFNILKKK